MYLHHTEVIPDEALPVRMNPGNGEPFGIIELGRSDVTVGGVGDARRILDAAQLAIDYFRVLGQKHPYQSGESGLRCLTCGMLKDWADHVDVEATAAPSAAIDAGTPVVPNPAHRATADVDEACCGDQGQAYICTAQAGHDGPEHIAWDSTGYVCHRWPVSATEPAVPWPTGFCGHPVHPDTWAQGTYYCPGCVNGESA